MPVSMPVRRLFGIVRYDTIIVGCDRGKGLNEPIKVEPKDRPVARFCSTKSPFL